MVSKGGTKTGKEDAERKWRDFENKKKIELREIEESKSRSSFNFVEV